MNGYAAQIKALLREAGWSWKRAGKGSHEIWGKDGCQPVTIPYECKSSVLANAILKHCGLPKKF